MFPRDVDEVAAVVRTARRVLPVGGIREKAVAALRYGISTVVIPAGNEADLSLLPTEVRDRLTFRPVDDDLTLPVWRRG